MIVKWRTVRSGVCNNAQNIAVVVNLHWVVQQVLFAECIVLKFNSVISEHFSVSQITALFFVNHRAPRAFAVLEQQAVVHRSQIWPALANLGQEVFLGLEF